MSSIENTGSADDFEIIRDPLWNTIRVDPDALRIIDTAVFQRLRHIRQLGHAYLVYPGATHTRFDHALGVYHLARRTLHLLRERGELNEVEEQQTRLIPYAALLHDIGHYPFSHALEELGPDQLAAHHEALTGGFLADPELGRVLADIGSDSAERIERLIRGRSRSPLQGLVAGSLDLDKIEYLNRDAMYCGVPYGVVDVDRLIHALTLLHDPETGDAEIGIHEKGVAALESLLFAKYQMFRNVYWHHGVRSATAVYKRAVETAVRAGLIEMKDLVGLTDEGLLGLLERRASESMDLEETRPLVERWLPALRNRRLPKRALEVAGERVRGLPVSDWLYDDTALRARLEDRLAAELGLEPGSVFVDYPEKPHMMGLDLLLLQRDGTTVRLHESGHSGVIDLPRIADDLYHSARVLRVFTSERREIDDQPILHLLELQPAALAARLDSSDPLLS